MEIQSDAILKRMQKLAEKRAKIEYKEKQLKEKARKRKTRRYIEIGMIASKFEIADFDNETLMGAFTEMQERALRDEIKEGWRKKGVALSKTSLQPLIISFSKEPGEELKQTLKAKRFKWNSIRKEWQGYGIKEEMEGLIAEFNGRIEVVLG